MDIVFLKNFCKGFGICNKDFESVFNGFNKIVSFNDFAYFMAYDNSSFSSLDIVFLRFDNEIVPSSYLLNKILERTRGYEISSYKKALDFVYSKNLLKNDFLDELPQNIFFIVTFEKRVLGYALFDSQKVVNKFNVGKYIGK